MPEPYQSYRGLPTLAGLATIAEAARPGLSVEACVARLKRYHYAFRRLHEIFTARITAEPIYELKTGFSHHAYLCAEHVQALRDRVGEMREPPLGLEAVPDAALEVFFDEILRGPDDRRAARRPLREGPARARRRAGPARGRHQPADRRPVGPRLPVRPARAGRHDRLRPHGDRLPGRCRPRARRCGPGSSLLDDCLAAAGGLDGAAEPSGRAIARQYSAKPYVYDPVPRRDERFQDL